ncbi:Response regulator receiver protein [Candidatus Sulfopaludibacter sp. SbA3]|nr:Response regulator receiver protein [Candidatus Sulfopaludibacter sp. SbA3]
MKTLLVLEDESAVMKLLQLMLKQYSVVEAATADQALELFTHRLRPIDLLLADVSLPKSSGIQVALLLRAQAPDLPVILTSGYPVSGWSARDVVDLERLGSDSVTIVRKPFQAQALREAVREMLPEIARTASS